MKINFLSRLPIASIFLLALIAPPNFVLAGTGAAEIFISIDKISFLDPEYLKLDIMADPAGQNFNAGEISLSFPPEILQLNSIAFASSSCEIIARQTIDNPGGKIYFICGTAEKNINYQTPLAQIKFNKTGSGMASLSLSGSSLAGADGLGTRITTATESHNILIIK